LKVSMELGHNWKIFSGLWSAECKRPPSKTIEDKIWTKNNETKHLVGTYHGIILH
jgi:hypothetical protein